METGVKKDFIDLSSFEDHFIRVYTKDGELDCSGIVSGYSNDRLLYKRFEVGSGLVSYGLHDTLGYDYTIFNKKYCTKSVNIEILHVSVLRLFGEIGINNKDVKSYSIRGGGGNDTLVAVQMKEKEEWVLFTVLTNGLLFMRKITKGDEVVSDIPSCNKTFTNSLCKSLVGKKSVVLHQIFIDNPTKQLVIQSNFESILYEMNDMGITDFSSEMEADEGYALTPYYSDKSEKSIVVASSHSKIFGISNVVFKSKEHSNKELKFIVKNSQNNKEFAYNLYEDSEYVLESLKQDDLGLELLRVAPQGYVGDRVFLSKFNTIVEIVKHNRKDMSKRYTFAVYELDEVFDNVGNSLYWSILRTPLGVGKNTVRFTKMIKKSKVISTSLDREELLNQLVTGNLFKEKWIDMGMGYYLVKVIDTSTSLTIKFKHVDSVLDEYEMWLTKGNNKIYCSGNCKFGKDISLGKFFSQTLRIFAGSGLLNRDKYKYMIYRLYKSGDIAIDSKNLSYESYSFESCKSYLRKNSSKDFLVVKFSEDSIVGQWKFDSSSKKLIKLA